MEKMDQIKQLDRELEQPADFTSPEVLMPDKIGCALNPLEIFIH